MKRTSLHILSPVDRLQTSTKEFESQYTMISFLQHLVSINNCSSSFHCKVYKASRITGKVHKAAEQHRMTIKYKRSWMVWSAKLGRRVVPLQGWMEQRWYHDLYESIEDDSVYFVNLFDFHLIRFYCSSCYFTCQIKQIVIWVMSIQRCCSSLVCGWQQRF